MSPRPRDILSNGASPAAAQARGRSPSSSTSVTSRESTVTPGDHLTLIFVTTEKNKLVRTEAKQ